MMKRFGNQIILFEQLLSEVIAPIEVSFSHLNKSLLCKIWRNQIDLGSDTWIATLEKIIRDYDLSKVNKLWASNMNKIKNILDELHLSILTIRNLAQESRQEILFHYLDFHMEKSVFIIWISPCDSLGKIFTGNITVSFLVCLVLLYIYFIFHSSSYSCWNMTFI